MSKIFETFGYRIGDTSLQAQSTRKRAWCPFMDCECDGGGNRHLSNVDLKRNPTLANLFPGRTEIPSGVCSLQMKSGESPWIVCPRRLLVLGRTNAGTRQHQSYAESLLLNHAGYNTGTRIGVWSEVKMKRSKNARGKSFDYTFDYILMPIGSVKSSDVELATGKKWERLKPIIQKAGYSIPWPSDTMATTLKIFQLEILQL